MRSLQILSGIPGKAFLALLALTPSAHAIDLNSVIGTWRLKSYTILENGREKPWCVNPSGLISYLNNGFMAVGINCKDEKGQWVPDPKDMVFYTGRYELKNGNTLVHHVEHPSDLSRVSKDLERKVELKGSVITLTGQGTKGLVRLIWEKIE